MLGIEILKRMGTSSGSSFGPISAYVSGSRYTEWTMDPDGFTYEHTDISGVEVVNQLSAWLTPQTGVDQYEVRATLLSGNIPNGNSPAGVLNTWQVLTSVRSWGWENQSLYKACELKIEIRRISGGAIVSTAFITLENNGTV